MAEEKRFVDLVFPRDGEAILALPVPGEALDGAPREELEGVAGYARGLLSALVDTRNWEHDEADPEAPPRFRFGSEQDFWALVTVVAGYYAYAMQATATDVVMAQAADYLIEEVPLDFPVDEDPMRYLTLLRALTILAGHDACTISLLMATALDDIGYRPGELPLAWDADHASLKNLSLLTELAEGAEGAERELVHVLLNAAVAYRLQMLRKRNEDRQEAAKLTLGELSPREMSDLARRSTTMASKYGSKRVERVFEQQLALLFQSFGFTVIQARPGEEAADLLCICRSGEKFSFLVDAKSSRSDYALPKADQRALADYAAAFGTDLPKLEMVLVVGAKAAKTVSGKARSLGDRIGIPVRFVPIGVLSELRASLPGPISPDRFKDEICSADPVVDKRIIAGMKEELEGIVGAYAGFSRDLRRALKR
jgi:hypothetical protein